MTPNEVLQIVETIHREGRIELDIIFRGFEVVLSADAKAKYRALCAPIIRINRRDGSIDILNDGVALPPGEFPLHGEYFAGRNKPLYLDVVLQRVREATRDILCNEYRALIGQAVVGTVERSDGGAVWARLKNTRAVLPVSEQIGGETFQPGEPIEAVVLEVRKIGSRAMVILSRSRAVGST